MTDKELKILGKYLAETLKDYEITDKELKNLGGYIANSLIEKAIDQTGINWQVEDAMDHLVGELARCMTLCNIYEEREEYEKCAVMKLKIDEINDKLGIDLSHKEEDDDEI
jgi:hypothetical protein